MIPTYRVDCVTKVTEFKEPYSLIMGGMTALYSRRKHYYKNSQQTRNKKELLYLMYKNLYPMWFLIVKNQMPFPKIQDSERCTRGSR